MYSDSPSPTLVVLFSRSSTFFASVAFTRSTSAAVTPLSVTSRAITWSIACCALSSEFVLRTFANNRNGPGSASACENAPTLAAFLVSTSAL